jgi:RHS repeat-associated protein
MSTTIYDTVNGQLVGESGGGVTTTYLADELGSVVQTAQSGAVLNRYQYSPYGRRISATGVGPVPRFGWVGELGYRLTSRNFAESYVRARHYTVTSARWLARDPLWPAESAYGYAHGSPNVTADPSGLGCSLLISGYLKHTACYADCTQVDFCFGVGPWFCEVGFQWHYSLKLRTTSCHSCDLYQWAKAPGGSCKRDFGYGYGWPLKHLRGTGFDTFDDWPVYSTGHLGCPPDGFALELITCICCGDGALCVYAVLVGSESNCRGATCTETGPLTLGTAFSKEVCSKK